MISPAIPAIDWPTTEQGWCEWWRRLDVKYATDARSPLHHDNRCTNHGKAVR